MAGRIVIEDKDDGEENRPTIQNNEPGTTTVEEESQPVKTPKTRRESPRTQDEEDDPYVDCDVCDARIHRDKLGNHKWKAHQIERRQGERKDESKVDLEEPPKKKEKKQESSSGDGKKKKSNTSSAWFGGRAND